MDGIDRKILSLLQADSTLSVSEIAGRVGLSSTPCWRRIQKLEREGVIRARVALLDPAKMNVGVTVFIAIRTSPPTRPNGWPAFRRSSPTFPRSPSSIG
jgi:Lrp/AsnC family transcriptional regulator